ncbi:MAG TPA: c-type cytochrome [Kofleriaceae bacterium]|nr:c-type cytochrome [Kofleriaceae bacterium]
MVTRLFPVWVAALLVWAAPACKKDNAKPSPSALSDAAGAATPTPPVTPPTTGDAAPTAAVAADAGAVATAAADAGARSSPPAGDDEDKPKNLKVLPKTWSKAKVNDYMKKQVARGTGMKCEACHVKDDFASDDNKQKLAARKMIALTDGINRDFFKKKPQVTCFTCHKGKQEVAAP